MKQQYQGDWERVAIEILDDQFRRYYALCLLVKNYVEPNKDGSPSKEAELISSIDDFSIPAAFANLVPEYCYPADNVEENGRTRYHVVDHDFRAFDGISKELLDKYKLPDASDKMALARIAFPDKETVSGEDYQEALLSFQNVLLDFEKKTVGKFVNLHDNPPVLPTVETDLLNHGVKDFHLNGTIAGWTDFQMVGYDIPADKSTYEEICNLLNEKASLQARVENGQIVFGNPALLDATECEYRITVKPAKEKGQYKVISIMLHVTIEAHDRNEQFGVKQYETTLGLKDMDELNHILTRRTRQEWEKDVKEKEEREKKENADKYSCGHDRK
jgi:hypothetical protein